MYLLHLYIHPLNIFFYIFRFGVGLMAALVVCWPIVAKWWPKNRNESTPIETLSKAQQVITML